MRVRYARARPDAGPAAAAALALAAEALLHLGERPEPEGLADEERLRQALEDAARGAGEADPGSAATATLDLLRNRGWIEPAGAAAPRLQAHPELLRLASLRALRTLLPQARPSGGAWPRAGVRGPHEPHGPERPWRWGEPLQLDAAATLKAGLLRGGLTLAELRVREGEGGRRSAVALLLDCSHSMVLYGVDRFGPAKRLALALHHWLGREGDRLRVVCFHDVAVPVPPERLPFLRALPSHTNTAAALEAAREWLRRQGDVRRRVVLVTDGRPTAVLRPDGRVYKNAWGRDPEIERATHAAAARLRRAGAELDVYMLDDEPQALARVRELARTARGRAFQVDPGQLGRRVLTDLMRTAR
ncbi:MAG TPA: VWA domain-containing protein [Oceanithermus profundus]|uniref:VWA domain-containing protein n=1 Tax=Oceanithermus profundus TaxID=187137 RepID=A0A7C5SSU5_9DEIN|nr:VWA domain-containing protein [Oceanithermus profundus]